jgi:hypothetical protein
VRKSAFLVVCVCGPLRATVGKQRQYDAANTHIHTGPIAHNAHARLQCRLIAFA